MVEELKMDTKHDMLIPVLGNAVETEKVKGVYTVKEKAIVGRLYKLDCPKCHQSLYVKAKEAKPWIEHCKQCGTKILVQGHVAETKAGSESITVSLKGKNPSSGRLVWGKIFFRKSYVLHEGVNYIGRRDNDVPSEVSLDDEYVSRRSVAIEVKKAQKGYTYKLTVERCANPVLINGRAQEVGNSVYLNYGDTIYVGNTAITFRPVKQ